MGTQNIAEHRQSGSYRVNKPSLIFDQMYKLWNVCRLEITFPVGWALDTDN